MGSESIRSTRARTNVTAPLVPARTLVLSTEKYAPADKFVLLSLRHSVKLVSSLLKFNFGGHSFNVNFSSTEEQ